MRVPYATLRVGGGYQYKTDTCGRRVDGSMGGIGVVVDMDQPSENDDAIVCKMGGWVVVMDRVRLR